MPKTLYSPKESENTGNSGVSITYIKSANRLDIFGWFDTFVGIEPSSLTLKEFFHELGITLKDCEKAFKNDK